MIGRTVVVHQHILCVLVSDPVGLGVVRQGDDFGLQASLLHHLPVNISGRREEVPAGHRSVMPFGSSHR